jgi:cation diffusion facilitator family transporter
LSALNASTAALYRKVTQAALLGLIVNLALGIAKLVGGLLGGSYALVADAVNSLGDVVSTIVVLVALRVAQRPPDNEHPYGHTRAEGIAATNVAVVIIMSALAIAWEVMGRSGGERPLPPGWTLWIAGLNVAIKEGLYRYKYAIGKRTGSAAIIANAWDHRSDALSALAVLFGLAVTRLGGKEFLWADSAASLVVVAAIIYSGVKLFHLSASELMDIQADEPMVEQIRAAAANVPGVRGVDKLWVRKSGLEYFADIHIEVDAQMSVADGHLIGHNVKDQLLARFHVLRDVLVHLEPYPHPPL